MPYTDAQGRPELIAEPFVKKGAVASRVVATSAADGQEVSPTESSDSVETSVGSFEAGDR